MKDTTFTPAAQPIHTDLTIHAGTCLPSVRVLDLRKRAGGCPAFVSASLQWGTQEVSVYIDPQAIAANADRFQDLADQLRALVAPAAQQVLTPFSFPNDPRFTPASVADICAKPAAEEGEENGV